MTQTQYLEQNSLGFEGDTILEEMFRELIYENRIDLVIETGTFRGATARKLATMCPQVVTIESSNENFKKASSVNSYPRPIYVFGDSVELLPATIFEFKGSDKTLFFLDAHWEANNPLLKELEIIALTGLKPFIVIHDFKVPNHPDLGFDSYGGQDYEWDWIAESIKRIYGEGGFAVYYNSDATGAKRGVIFIQPAS